MGMLHCEVCGDYVDKVVLSFGTRTWDEVQQAYVHRDDDEEGDWTCAGCGTPIPEKGTRFYPPEEQQKRPFPQAYDDWARLAAEINAKYRPDEIEKRSIVNFQLNLVKREEENPPEAEEAKRWLARKAGELGIT